MILQALCDYYERKSSDTEDPIAPPGFEWKPIPFVVEIDANGRLVQVSDTRFQLQGKLRAKKFLVPQDIGRSSNVAANSLWDKASYALGVNQKVGATKLAKQKEVFVKEVKRIADKLPDDPALKALLVFLNAQDMEAQLERSTCYQELVENDLPITFQFVGDKELICQRSKVLDVLRLSEDDESDTTEGVCAVTGKVEEIAQKHSKTPIPGSKSNAKLVSFNDPAYISFGKKQSLNASIGKCAAFAYTTALNHLLLRRIQVGDASTVFWSEKHTDLEDTFADLFDEPPKDDPAKQTRAIEALFKAPQTGAISDEGGNTRFYVLGLAPNIARISVRFWQVGTVAEMSARIRQHFEDLKISHASFEKPYLSLFRLLKSIATQEDSKNIPPNLAGEFMRAILAGLPYPQTLLQAAVRRIRAEREVTYHRAALIKACLNRQARYSPSQEKEIAVSLDDSNTNPGYRIGRLFSALEKIQEEASPGLNATIRDRFYGAASSSPVTVFANLMKLKNHHLAKLEEGRKRYFEKLIGQIMSVINDFPAHLSLADQGRFAIGYYHQRQAFFTKSESTTKGE